MQTSIRIIFPATRDQVLKSFPVIVNLADTPDDGKINVVNEGLLKTDSPRGVWEISDKGKARLRQSD